MAAGPRPMHPSARSRPRPILAAALALDPRAGAAFERLGRTDRYALILPILKAATPAGRAGRVEKAIARLVSL